MAIRKDKIEQFTKIQEKQNLAFEKYMNSPEVRESIATAENGQEIETKMRLFNGVVQNGELDHMLNRLPAMARFLRRLQKQFHDIQNTNTSHDTMLDQYKDVISLVYIMTEECRVHEVLNVLKENFPEYFE